MLTTKEAIEKRRSIRKFKPDPVPSEHIMELIEAARLAPSGCNAQPWRFKIVEDQETKDILAQAAHGQKFIAKAPVVIVCISDIKGHLTGMVSGVQDLGRIGALEGDIVKILSKKAEVMDEMPIDQIAQNISFNVAIAIEHMVLRALDFGLGSCWIRLLDYDRVNELFGLEKTMQTIALLPIGYPAEDPAPRKRAPLESLLL